MKWVRINILMNNNQTITRSRDELFLEIQIGMNATSLNFSQIL